MSRIRKDTEAPAWVSEDEEPKAVKAPPAYQPFPKREWTRSRPEDKCGEPGCTKSVAEHQAEIEKLLGIRIPL